MADHCEACPFAGCAGCEFKGGVNHGGPCPTCSEPGTNCPNEEGETCCLPCWNRIGAADDS